MTILSSEVSMISRLFFRSLLVALLLSFLSPLHAATFYLSPAGSDSAGNGSRLKPWKTISLAARGNDSPSQSNRRMQGTIPQRFPSHDGDESG
ncbi:MAG: hypothetical protein ACYC35_14865 [Pirellulales bacterium]